MAITAAMVKELREKTGAGMMDCKNALNENSGDLEAALDWLRVKGLAKAAKKGGRVASEGLVGIGGDASTAAMVEVNSETDFVARNEQFQTLVSEIAGVAAATDGDHEALLAAAYPGADKSVADQVTAAIATIGENMTVRRSIRMVPDNGVVASYVHNAAAAGLGKIGVLVHLDSEGDKDKLSALGKQIAMHIAATNPLALSDADVDPALMDRERAVFSQQAKESGKPDNIIEKMVEGRLRKYLEEIVLLKQSFVVDPDKTIEKAVKDAEGDIGASVTVKAFSRFELGDGIVKEEEDFAAEVAAVAKGG